MAGHARRALSWIGSVLVLVLVASAGPASAHATTTVGAWRLDEAPGARTALDSSGYRQHGSVGSGVSTGVRVDGATAYRFPAVDARTVRPQHLVTVPTSARLNPGPSDFAVSVRFRTTRALSNIVQKGQSTTAGGYWKVEVADGRVGCHFRTGTGSGLAVGSTRRIDDGRWHAVRCERTGPTVSLVLDGVRQRTRTGLIGGIGNTWAVSIGGKPRCDQVRVGCDYFAGDLDYVWVHKG